MLKTIARFILLCLLAWFLTPLLNVILPLPTENMVKDYLDLSTNKDRETFSLLRFIIWVVALGLLFKYTGPIFSFVLPITSRYSTTKPMRRFQGMFAEVFLFGMVFLFATVIISSIPAYNTYKQTLQKHENETMLTAQSQRNELVKKKKEHRKAAEAFVKSANANYHVPFEIWPNIPSKDISEYSLDDVIAHPEKYRMPIYDDVRLSPEYQTFFNEQKRLHDEVMKFDREYYLALADDKFMKSVHDYDVKRTWEEHGSTLKLLIKEAKKYFFLILAIAIVIYALIYFTSRRDIGGFYERLLRFLEQGRFGFGGSARFAGLFEEWRTLFKNQKEGLFMGRSLYNPFLNIGLEDSRHMLTIAGSRAGKGTTVIIPNLLLWKGSSLVIDPKGTNAAVTARRRKEMGQNVHLIDPFGILGKGKSASFNPLEKLDPNSPTIREEINIITEALVVPDQNQKERHWDDGAKTVIAGLIAHLVTSPKYEKPTLPMLRDLISMLPEQQIELWAEMSMNDGAGRLAKDAATRVIRGIGSNEISSILSNADKHTEWLSSPAMKETLGSSSFEFADLKSNPTTVYLIIPPQFLETHNRFLRLFVNLSISQMAIGGRAKVPVLLMMDEFLALGRMEEVEKAFGLMAGYNLLMWPFVQDLGRLKHLYGPSVNAFITNSRAIQIFGVSDEETKEFVSKYIGERRLGRRTKIGGLNDVVSLRMPNEVMIDISADSGRQYILRAGKAPLVLEKVIYYDSAPSPLLESTGLLGKKGRGLFEGLYDPDPDYKKV